MATCPIKCELPNYFPLGFDLWRGKRGETTYICWVEELTKKDFLAILSKCWKCWVRRGWSFVQMMPTNDHKVPQLLSSDLFARLQGQVGDENSPRCLFPFPGKWKLWALMLRVEKQNAEVASCKFSLPLSPQSSCQGSGELRLGINFKLISKLSKKLMN